MEKLSSGSLSLLCALIKFRVHQCFNLVCSLRLSTGIERALKVDFNLNFSGRAKITIIDVGAVKFCKFTEAGRLNSVGEETKTVTGESWLVEYRRVGAMADFMFYGYPADT